MASSTSSHHFGWENSIYHNVIAINVKHHRPSMIDDGCCFGFGVDFFCNSKTTLLVNISSITERSQLPKYPIHIIMTAFGTVNTCYIGRYVVQIRNSFFIDDHGVCFHSRSQVSDGKFPRIVQATCSRWEGRMRLAQQDDADSHRLQAVLAPQNIPFFLFCRFFFSLLKIHAAKICFFSILS